MLFYYRSTPSFPHQPIHLLPRTWHRSKKSAHVPPNNARKRKRANREKRRGSIIRISTAWHKTVRPDPRDLRARFMKNNAPQNLLRVLCSPLTTKEAQLAQPTSLRAFGGGAKRGQRSETSVGTDGRL